MILPPTESAVKAVAGHSFSVVLTASGRVFVCGRNQSGQLGLGHQGTMLLPTPLDPVVEALAEGLKVVDIAAGYRHTVIALSDGTVYAVGDNRYGQVTGSPTEASEANLSFRHIPTYIPGAEEHGQSRVPLRSCVTCAAGLHHSAALMRNGGVVVWGRNEFGELGVPPSVHAPCLVSDLPQAHSLSAGADVTAIVAMDRQTVIAWGAEV
ncbi:hypothetical protein KIPB_005957 [Kipferlia bialata]|uniref:Regulator of chromosome condensation 1/beta-lactamase-inhibitor protein II n=1 Tax=Kipferlia bialata TaxID=797122 RepID=A0A9K3GIQ5_9EUKA|nr:hypothetical protein KIPB_005957 [Kipferlia bialata]|eukprot:g5957.t1